jgi:hypothetical protein
MALRETAARECQQFLKLLRELFGVKGMQRTRCRRIRSGRAADAEVDAARMKRRKRVKVLGHTQRRVIRQHDAAGTDVNSGRR